QSVVVIDPHYDLIKAILSTNRFDTSRYILLDPTDWHYPFGLNLFESHASGNPLLIQQVSDKALGIIKHAWLQQKDNNWGGTIEEILGQVCSTFVQVP